MEKDQHQNGHERQPLIGDTELEPDPYFTDDEDEISTTETTSNFSSSNDFYQRRGRKSTKSSSKWPKNGHSRTKSEGSALFQQGIPDHLTNVEMLSNCQISRRRVQSTSRDRDLSPSEVIKNYYTKEKEQIDVMIGRIVHNVEDLAEVAAQKSSAVVKNIVHNVHEKAEVAAQKSSKIVHTAFEKSSQIADVAAQKSSEIVHNALEKSSKIADQFWKVCHFEKLAAWQKDNEHLLFGHRPELSSATECFKSIFRIHTETGNIWTHMIGFFAFLVVTIVFYVKPLCDNCHAEVSKHLFMVVF